MEELLKNLKNLDRDHILGALGLERRGQPQDQILPALGIFAAGLVVGTGMGMLLAPRTGRTLRRQLRRGAGDIVDKVQDTAQELRASRST